jgi:hypothetical protein
MSVDASPPTTRASTSSPLAKRTVTCPAWSTTCWFVTTCSPSTANPEPVAVRWVGGPKGPKASSGDDETEISTTLGATRLYRSASEDDAVAAGVDVRAEAAATGSASSSKVCTAPAPARPPASPAPAIAAGRRMRCLISSLPRGCRRR